MTKFPIIITNKFEKHCLKCDELVPAGIGFAIKESGTAQWFTLCSSCHNSRESESEEWSPAPQEPLIDNDDLPF